MFVGCTLLLLQLMNVVLFTFLYGLLSFNKVNSEKKLSEGDDVFAMQIRAFLWSLAHSGSNTVQPQDLVCLL
jgi:hypothetical protein